MRRFTTRGIPTPEQRRERHQRFMEGLRVKPGAHPFGCICATCNTERAEAVAKRRRNQFESQETRKGNS